MWLSSSSYPKHYQCVLLCLSCVSWLVQWSPKLLARYVGPNTEEIFSLGEYVDHYKVLWEISKRHWIHWAGVVSEKLILVSCLDFHLLHFLPASSTLLTPSKVPYITYSNTGMLQSWVLGSFLCFLHFFFLRKLIQSYDIKCTCTFYNINSSKISIFGSNLSSELQAQASWQQLYWNHDLSSQEVKEGSQPLRECCRERAQERHIPTSLLSLQPFVCASSWLNGKTTFCLCFLLVYWKPGSRTDIDVALTIGPWSTKQDGEGKCEWDLLLYIRIDTTTTGNSVWGSYKKKGLRPASSSTYLEQRSQSDNLWGRRDKYQPDYKSLLNSIKDFGFKILK